MIIFNVLGKRLLIAASELELAGETDWRLPSIDELNSIVVKSNSPAIDIIKFPDTHLGFYWSSTVDKKIEGSACMRIMDFYDSSTRWCGTTNGYYYTRCVRSTSAELPPGGTVTINGLTWQQRDDNIQRTWQEASNYCSDLKLAGKTDWRLPSIDELNSIVVVKSNLPTIDIIKFPDTHLGFYWFVYCR